MPLYVDIHLLHTLPPSNINRDDVGAPKTAVYGGVRRSRVSSQAWKRATRMRFGDFVDEQQLGTRTKRIAAMLAERITARGIDPEAAAIIATALLRDLEIKPGRKAAETAYLLFFGSSQLEKLIDTVADRLPDLAAMEPKAAAAATSEVSARAILGVGHPIDVALFGRMVADIPGLNVDAATQVAHALSTHAVEPEFDYYTAVDDRNSADETGAGMIGHVGFASSTLYRYATVGLHQLRDNLGGDAEATSTALEAFLRSFTTSMPTGHQNSFAALTRPDLVSVVLRSDQPVNLVSAFERPIRQSEDGGYVTESIRRLGEEMTRAQEEWGTQPDLVVSQFRPILESASGDRRVSALRSLGTSVPFDEVISRAMAASMERQDRW